MTPLGLIKKKLAPEMSERMVPLMDDGLPPVTRLKMFWILAGPVNVATSPDARLNCAKLWNRLFPCAAPIDSVMCSLGPTTRRFCRICRPEPPAPGWRVLPPPRLEQTQRQ